VKIVINEPLDMHLHLRDKEMLDAIAKLSSFAFSGGVIMPNTVPPITTKELLLDYKIKILNLTVGDQFEPYMTLFFQNYDYDFLNSIKGLIKSIKLYPAGITTNSDGGVDRIDVESLRPTLEAMSELGIILSIHGESNGFVMDREKDFISTYSRLAEAFPKLKIVMEHITTKEAAKILDKYKNLYATITLHHLLITLDDVAGGMLQPHLFCKPIAKRDEDRDALLNLALNAHPKVMFGSDSAPHPQNKKESCGCAAGIFTAPIALQKLAELFDDNNRLDNLEKFVSNNAKNIYNITPTTKKVILEKADFIVPKKYGNVVPMYAGEIIKWSICEVII